MKLYSYVAIRCLLATIYKYIAISNKITSELCQNVGMNIIKPPSYNYSYTYIG